MSVCLCLCVCLTTVCHATGIEGPAEVYGTENSAGVFGTRRRNGTTRLSVRRVELAAAFLVQVCSCAGLNINTDANLKLAKVFVLQACNSKGHVALLVGMRFKHPLNSDSVDVCGWVCVSVCPHGFLKCFFSVISCPIELIF